MAQLQKVPRGRYPGPDLANQRLLVRPLQLIFHISKLDPDPARSVPLTRRPGWLDAWLILGFGSGLKGSRVEKCSCYWDPKNARSRPSGVEFQIWPVLLVMIASPLRASLRT